MATLQFKKAKRSQVAIKIGIGGPSGSGKTMSSLLLAKAPISTPVMFIQK